MKLDGKVTVVTGAASGIGRGIARRFAQEGARVVCSDIDGDGAAAVAQEIDGLAVTTNVAAEADIQALVVTTEDTYGPIDLFFSNAGIGTSGGVEVADCDWQRIWDINVMAHVYAARTLLPKMIERGHGYLCSTASAAGLLTQIGSAPYAVTKHAAVALAEWLSVTHGDQGIRVSVLCPQAVRSKMTARGGGVASVDGMLEPEEVAEAVVSAIDREEFLILPHPEVLTYMQRKTSDYDRWLGGMRRLQGNWRERVNEQESNREPA